MDEFDIIDMVYDHVANANTGLVIYIDRSKAGEEQNHIVINHMEFHEQEWFNILPVNVNIFIKQIEGNFLPKRQLLKQHKRAVRKELLKIKTENGKYRKSEVSGSVPLPGLKEGFDCINIRITVKTEKLNYIKT